MPQTEAMVLGSAQDAGVPQIGCLCVQCQDARVNADKVRLPTALALVDHQEQAYWLVDATPSVAQQMDILFRVFPGYDLNGVLLTHAHMGHYVGLVQFGPEAWNKQGLPVYATAKMIEFLVSNQPWASLADGHLKFSEIQSGEVFHLSEGLEITACIVPHRDEFSDTLAYFVRGKKRNLFYCPDIDSWGEYRLEDVLEPSSIALLDGTFFSQDELPGRDLSKIPHPFVRNNLAMLSGLEAEIWLVHLNHSNPLVVEGEEREMLKKAGIGVASEQQRWPLG